jgi:hypothetical protein
MSEARRLLEALAAGGVGASKLLDFWCVYCGKDNSHLEDAPDDVDERHEEDCPVLDARAYLAQPMTTSALVEALETVRWHCGKRMCEGCIRVINDALASDSSREGELVAALKDARMLCVNDPASDNKHSQVFEAVQVMNRALAQGEHIHKWIDARNEVIKSGVICMDCGALESP